MLLDELSGSLLLARQLERRGRVLVLTEERCGLLVSVLVPLAVISQSPLLALGAGLLSTEFP